MEMIKGLLEQAIRQANDQRGNNPVATSMMSELASVATRYFKADRPYCTRITSIIKGREAIMQAKQEKLVAAAGANTNQALATTSFGSKWAKEWTGQTAGGNYQNRGPVVQAEAAAVKDDAPNDPEQPETTDLSFFVGKTPQQVLEHFGSFDNLKEFCRELALDINYRLGANNFIEAFVDMVNADFGAPDGTELDEEE